MTGKTKFASVRVLGAAVAGVVAFAAPAGAATRTWDTDLTNNGVITDGSGNWNKVAGNTIWSDGASNTVWTDLDNAVFGGNAGTPGAVTIGTTFVRATNITFNKPYTITDTSTTIRLILDGNVVANETSTIRSNRTALMQANSTNPAWTVASGKTFTMDSLLAQYIVGGNAASTINGAKTLTLDGAGTVAFTALSSEFGLSVANSTTLNVNSGTMTVSARSTTDNLAIVVRGGASSNSIAGGVFNQNGGLTDLGTIGILNVATANGQSGTANLNGGTLAVAKVVGTTTGAGNGGIFRFNGGTLRANLGDHTISTDPDTNASFMPSNTAGGMTSTLVAIGGGTFDAQGFSITVDQSLAEDSTSTGGGITKSGVGALTLTKVNTYTGDTTVSAGTLTLADDAALKFVFGPSGVNNSVEGAGTALLDGDFNFDLTGASTTVGSSWLVVNNATLSETFGGTFTVAGFSPVGLDLWTQAISPTAEYVFSESTGTLSVVAIPEPASLALLGLAAGRLMLRRRSG